MPNVTFLLPFFHKYHGTVRSLSVSLYNRQIAPFFLRNVDLKVDGNIETMSLEI